MSEGSAGATAIQLLFAGVGNGAIYALIALGFNVIFKSTGALNFAQGEWMMVAGVFGIGLLNLGVPYPVAVVGSVAGATALAMLAERLVITPLQRRDASPAIMLLALFGIMLVARYGTGILHGKLEDPLPGPAGMHVFRFGADVLSYSPEQK